MLPPGGRQPTSISMKLTPPKFRELKGTRKIVMLTAYDFPSAAILDGCGVDVILVGDSLGNVVQGRTTTLSVTLEQMIYHAEMVVRAVSDTLVVVDLPFPFCQLGPKAATKAAARILKETQADAVKIEGGADRASTIAAVVAAGIPVVGHCGLLPQAVRKLGRFVVQRQREQILADVAAVEAAGAFGVVLECITADIADEATRLANIPTIGIGAGSHCDGQVLVFHDLLGFSADRAKTPRHVKRYADLRQTIEGAAKQYADEVRNGIFPGKESSFR